MKIVSGAQTGVDKAALDAAIKLGIPTGGWVPKGRYNERGQISDKYSVKETPSSGYRQRTRRNVCESDGTLILVRGSLRGGSKLTRNVANEQGKPCLVVNLLHKCDPVEVVGWLVENDILTLNVAGSRESSSPGIGKVAERRLSQILINWLAVLNKPVPNI